eukprot:gene10465-21835_t
MLKGLFSRPKMVVLSFLLLIFEAGFECMFVTTIHIHTSLKAYFQLNS